ncbi:hypothetical protein [Microbacterium sp. bgisy203]|uniref:hypothetical protein n=1 Tax=Microbacterium sp. bgisy203 TaxID=3413799 RepID=UPI003D70BED1
MRRHLRWIVPALLAAAVYLLAMWGVTALAGPDRSPTPNETLGALGLLAVAFVGPLVLVVVAIVQGVKTYRAARRRRGHFSKGELRLAGERAAHQHAWDNARALRATLLRREVPASIDQWDLAPYAGELFFAAVPTSYARYYGTDARYTTTSSFAYGSPAFVLGVMAITGIGNAASRSAARQQAREQWRDWQQAHVLVSNHRLAVRTAEGWLSFDYGAMTAVYPEVAANTLVCEFPGVAPLLLQGPHAPLAAVMSVFATRGADGLARHPSLSALD